jgi:hypothetical protein
MGDRDSTNRSELSRTLIGVLVLLWLSVFLNYIDRSNLSIAAPQLKGELGLSATQLGVLLSAFFWTYACLQIPAGWLVDRLEVKWVFAGGFFIWSAATALTGVLHTFAALLAVRVVLGIGESVAYPSYSKIIANHFPLARRGLANSIVASGLCFGPSFGMLFGGTLMGRFGWRPFFVILGLTSLLWLGPWSIWMPRAKAYADHDSKTDPGLPEIVARRAWVATASVVCHELRQLFSAYLAPVLPRARARVLDARNGEGGRGDVVGGSALSHRERKAFRPLDSQRRDHHTGAHRIHGGRRSLDRRSSHGRRSCTSKFLRWIADAGGHWFWNVQCQRLGHHADSRRATGRRTLGGIAELHRKPFRRGGARTHGSSGRSYRTFFLAVPDYRVVCLVWSGSVGVPVGSD